VTTTPQKVPVVKQKSAAPATQTVSQEPSSFTAAVAPKTATLGTDDQYPVRLIIPSIDLSSPIVPVGVNSKGEMAVPSGSTNNIGWYKGGPMPGSPGSAVLDAHVFAALKDLRYVKVGDPVYVLTKGGTRLRFIVKESTVFTLSEITSDILFGRSGGRWLNIITCAGAYIPSLGTYDHRLVDFALFDGEELD
jgi:sortase (surface protein transpeptidase)